MRLRLRFVLPLGFAAAICALAAIDARARARAANDMASAANRFLQTLDASTRQQAVLPLDDPNRFDWHYIPRDRKGLPLKSMSAAQRAAAMNMLRTAVSQRGYTKATLVMEIETVLREIEKDGRMIRDPELYYFTVFGTPSSKAPWGWRVEGHHLSLNFTIGGDSVSTTPQFFGANPARVPFGPREGLRVLDMEEDHGRALVKSLDEKQRQQAIIDATAPRDIVTTNTAKIDPLNPAGIAADALRPDQVALLKKLIDEYVTATTPELAALRRTRLERAGFSRIHFAWAGGIERGDLHYYRVQGPTFLIEYDNTQNKGNHIHSVWRDYENDFGRDLLREHYKTVAH